MSNTLEAADKYEIFFYIFFYNRVIIIAFLGGVSVKHKVILKKLIW